MNFSRPSSLPKLGEMEQTICMLERGTIVRKFYSKHRPEQRILILVRETRQLLWSLVDVCARTDYEGSLDLREIKEIRSGKDSKEFRNFQEEAKKFEDDKCFVIFYGNSFKLKTFSVVALSEQECDNWMRGLTYMVQDTLNAPYPSRIECWLRREYYNIENNKRQSKEGGQISVKDFKTFLAGIGFKVTTSKLMEFFSDDDIRRKNDLHFDDFARLYRKLLIPQNFVECLFSTLPGIFLYSKNNRTVTLQEFKKFLIQEQKEDMYDDAYISNFIRDFIQDVERDIQEPYFTIDEFVDYLFSQQNDLWNNNYDRIYMDMQQPLSNYWIASSHNTYLTGDQFSSESSTEAYARVLRMGCRCVELDCWNGPDNLPYIFHGHTMTSKIKFLDVIKTIKEHAFVTSEYPVILSIEQNCSLEQQRNMAHVLTEVFGDMLLTQRCDRSETQLPSPHQLRRKIILKHKKLPEYDDGKNFGMSGLVAAGTDSRTSLSGSVFDETENMRKILKEGVLHYKDHVDKTWNLYHFTLTQQEIIYTSEINGCNQNMSEEDENGISPMSVTKSQENLINEELHFSENWFHGKLEGGRREADQLLEAYKHLGDGTFLVRESATFVGDYSLSFWRRNRPNHCRIKIKNENGLSKYYLMDHCDFDSLYSLIVHYRKNMLRSSEFSITLKEPVPQPKKHESQEWFHPNVTKEQAENVLDKMEAGSFLVRPSAHRSNTFVISFAIGRKTKHCRIMQEGRLYVVDSTQFESLISLVNFYARNALYRNIRLLYSVSHEALRQKLASCQLPERLCNASDFNDSCSYMDPSLEDRVTCKALYSYTSDRMDELSFPKHAIITNVRRNSTMWWRGDYGGMIQRHLPANYVKVIDTIEEDKSLFNNFENSENFSRTGSIEIYGAIASLYESHEPGIPVTLQIQTPTMQNALVIGFQNQDLAYEWIKAIQEAAKTANQMATERRKKERTARVAKEMSDLIIYFRSVPFREYSWLFYEMSSFPETKAEKQFLQQNTSLFISYHRNQISRVYPKGQRLDSSNFNPISFWNVGSQMIALNYQTGDKAMQFNQAKFRDNGRCGYLLKPKFMLSDHFDPTNHLDINELEAKVVSIHIIGARHLFRGGKCNNPLVVVEIAGASFDSGIKHRTKVNESGFNPIWNETCEFSVRNPYFAILRFEILEEDMFGETHFIAQACYPLNCIRSGYRSVALRNKFSEDLELASLLIYIKIKHTCSLDNFQVE